MRKFFRVSVGLMLLFLLCPVTSYAITIYIGDADGLGFAKDLVPSLMGRIYTKPDTPALSTPADRDKNGILNPGDILPDLNEDPDKLGLTNAQDTFDNRSPEEKEDVAEYGEKFSDVGLVKNKDRWTGAGLPIADWPGGADSAMFKFVFTTTNNPNDPYHGQDHYFSVIYGDNDVPPLKVYIDGEDTELVNNQDAGVNGYIGLAYAVVPWSKMEDGEVVVALNAPKEPFVALDLVGLDVRPGFDGVLSDLPIMGLTKRVVEPVVDNGDGTYTVEYEIVVTNMGDVELVTVQVEDDLSTTFTGANSFEVIELTSDSFTVNPDFDGILENPDISDDTINLLVAEESTLAVGATGTIRLRVMVEPGDNLGPYNNTAVGAATGPFSGSATDNLPPVESTDGTNPDPDGSGFQDPDENEPTSVTFTPWQPGLAIDKTPATQEVVSGGTASFTLNVTNTGDVPLSNIVVTDAQCTTGPTLTGGDTNTDSKLDLTETWSYTCEIADVTANLTNTATVDGDDPNGEPVPQARDTAEVTVIGPGLAIDKTPATQEVVSGGTASFTLNVTNTGDVPLSNIVVTDAQCTTGPTLTGGDTNTDSKLDLTETWSYTCEIADVTANLTNTATVDGDDPNGEPVPQARDTAEVTVIGPGLAIDKTPATQEVVSGGTASFTLNVTNTGDVPLSNIVVTDAQCTTGPTLTGGDTNTDSKLDLTETWSYTCEIADVTANLTNTATVDGDDPNGEPVPQARDTAEVTVIGPGLAIDKTPATQEVVSGGTASFTLNVTNTGDVPLSNIVVTDAQCTTGPTLTGGDTNTDSKLDLTETWSYTCEIADVTANLTNTATVDGDDPNGEPVPQARDTAEVTVIGPGLAIDKTPATQEVVSGGTASFTLNVTNTGDVPLSNIVVTDAQCTTGPTLTGGDTNTDSKLDLTETWSYTCEIADVTANLTNIASATGEDAEGNKVSDSDAAEVTVPSGGAGDIDILKEQKVDSDWTVDTLLVNPGDTISYKIRVTNYFNVAVELMLLDSLSAFVENVRNLTLGVNESDFFTSMGGSGQIFNLDAGKTLEIVFDVDVILDVPMDEFINNTANLSYRDPNTRVEIDKMSFVQAEVVPEPATLLFFSTGLLGIFALVRRKRRQKK